MSVALGAYLGLSRLADLAAPAILRRRMARGKEDPGRLPERLGHAGLARPAGRLVWLHGASVGETLSALPLIEALLGTGSDLHVLVTAGTRGAAETLAGRLPERALHQYAPVDTARSVARFLAHWRPDLAIWMESELWPRMVHATAEAGVPMALINARLSATAARGWGRAPGMARALLSRFALVTAQDSESAARLTALGAPEPRLIANLKSVASLPAADPETLAAWRAAVADRPVWLAASTHAPEEEAAIAAHGQIGRADLLTVIVPRHPDRGPDIMAQARTAGLGAALRSETPLPTSDTGVFVADSFGEMGLWYRAVPIAFVGGTLAPMGGHNPFEPAETGAAILHGPSVANFADIYAALAADRAVMAIADADALGPAVARLMAAPEERAAMAKRAETVRRAHIPDLGTVTRALRALLDR